MIRLAIHGGAGDLALGTTDLTPHHSALQAIAARGYQALREGAPALDVVEQLVVELEECPLFNAGVGAVLSRDGMPELDAAIMDGQRRCGAVAGVTRTRNPIRLARGVMERSPHVMFIGAGAEALGRELGLEQVDPTFFITEERFHQLKIAQEKGVIVLDHDDDEFIDDESERAANAAADPGFGTVGAVAMDDQGQLAAATSTGGLTNKHPGRVGDTPIPGAGTFADNESLALSCTGTGESFIRAMFGQRVHGRMSWSGLDLQQACDEALDVVRGYGGRGGLIAIDKHGKLYMPFNSKVMFRAWSGDDGAIQTGVGR